MLPKFPWGIFVVGLLAAATCRAQTEPAPADTSGGTETESIVELRQEFNTAIADMAARLNEARNRQAQASVDGVLYLRYSDEVMSAPGSNMFEIDRAYLNVRGALNRRGVYRVTLDAGRTSSPPERLFDFMKYAYGGVAFSPEATVTLGMQTTPLIDFLESVWTYRFAMKVLSDDEKVLSSSDLGLAAEGAATGTLAYRVMVSNGEGYTKPEANHQKDFAGRLTYTVMPGLRVSAYAHSGRVDTSQVRNRYDVFASLEKPAFTVFAEALGAEDQAKPGGVRIQSGGLSFGGFWEYVQDWRVFAKFDLFDPNRQAPDNAHTHNIVGVSYNWGSNLVVAVTNQWATYGAAAGTRNNDQVSLQAQVTY